MGKSFWKPGFSNNGGSNNSLQQQITGTLSQWNLYLAWWIISIVFSRTSLFLLKVIDFLQILALKLWFAIFLFIKIIKNKWGVRDLISHLLSALFFYQSFHIVPVCVFSFQLDISVWSRIRKICIRTRYMKPTSWPINLKERRETKSKGKLLRFPNFWNVI